MRKIIFGAGGTALVGVLAFVVLLAVVPAAEAQPCHEQDAVRSWDMHYELESKETRLGRLLTISQIEYSTDLKRIIDTSYLGDQQTGPPTESIMDMANRKQYWRTEGEEWSVSSYEGEIRFPRTTESICPDLANALVTFIGDDTIDGKPTRKYSYETETKLFDWYFWVDSSGWLIKGESTRLPPGPDSKAIEDKTGLYGTFIVTNRGEPNKITIPQADQ